MRKAQGGPVSTLFEKVDLLLFSTGSTVVHPHQGETLLTRKRFCPRFPMPNEPAVQHCAAAAPSRAATAWQSLRPSFSLSLREPDGSGVLETRLFSDDMGGPGSGASFVSKVARSVRTDVPHRARCCRSHSF